MATTPRQVLEQLARSNAELATKLDALNRSVSQTSTGIGLGVTQGLLGSLSGGVLGALRGSLSVAAGALQQGLMAGARDAAKSAGLLREQAAREMEAGPSRVAHALQGLADEATATSEAFESFSQIAGGLGGIITTLITLPSAIIEQIKGPVGLASPNTASTFQGNLNLLAATIGRDLIPVLQGLSVAVNAARNAYTSSGLSTLTRMASAYATAKIAEQVVMADTALNAVRGLFGQERTSLLAGFAQDLPQFTQSRYTSGADYYDTLQTSALNASGNQTQQELLKLQLQQAQKDGLLLEKIEAKLPGIPFGGWRG